MRSFIPTLVWTSAGLIAAFACANAAFAQPSELAIASDKDWQHQWTAMAFPARIDGFLREKVLQFEDRQTNVAANYWDEDSKTLLSIYIYRPVQPDSAIWFDRALVAIGANEIYEKVDLDTVKVDSFAPRGSDVASGNYAVIALDGRFKSTAVSLYRSGEWLIKLRISSQELSVPQMDRLLKKVLAGLPETGQPDAQPAYLVEECTTSLAFGPAKPFSDPNGDAALALEASLIAMTTKMANVSAGPPVRYCREGSRGGEFSIYRANGRPDGYTVAVGDAGKTFAVFPQPLYGAEPGGASAVNVHRVQSGDGLSWSIFRPFVGMPSIQQAIDTVYGGAPLSEVGRPLGDENINVRLLVAPSPGN